MWSLMDADQKIWLLLDFGPTYQFLWRFTQYLFTDLVSDQYGHFQIDYYNQVITKIYNMNYAVTDAHLHLNCL